MSQLAAMTLDDKYELESGRVYLSGIQALVRLPIMQRQRDVAAGLNTASFITGYRGSPLGGYDVNLWRAQRFLAASHVTFQPGVNEDLAATSIWGSQQAPLFDDCNYDGVVGIWYGKGPGVDRSGDALKHGSLAGAAAHGGVLCLAGDDHGCKSSTLPHQSEQAFVHYMIPVLNPATVDEYLELGLHGIAMSRFSGAWIAFKAISEAVETSASVDLDPLAQNIVLPENFAMPDDGLNIRINDDRFVQERRQIEQRLPAVQAFSYANRLDRVVVDGPSARLGIAAPGKAYLDVMEALAGLGIDAQQAADLGLRIYKIALSWPLDPRGAIEFATGLEEILVIEEKRGFVEDQLKSILFNQDNVARRVVGKADLDGKPLVPEHYVINPTMVARVLVDRLGKFTNTAIFEQRLARLESLDADAASSASDMVRSAFFCSGCPHNTSTKVPEGSMAMAGIGCHAIARSIPGRRTELITHMGAEGSNWIGRAPFTKTKHVFQNLGDGTYFHSGLMAIRAAAASGVNITYKILYNDAVAMTGGQPIDGQLTVDQIARQVHAEGVKRLVIVTDEPEKYPAGMGWPKGTRIYHRDELDRVQRELREIEGCTALIYDQTCAAEKRRRRKRGTFPDPDKRVFINSSVCEGCGDCSVASNCISVQPFETEFGRKRRIDQSNCNKDFSCIKGFCPSFVTVHGGELRRIESRGADIAAEIDMFAELPEPTLPSTDEPYGILITGIGGTGVVTIGALLGTAAHIEGRNITVMDDTGLSQKNGAVASHLRIADSDVAIHSSRLPTASADLLLACDMVEGASKGSLARCTAERTRSVVNSKLVPTAAFVVDWNMSLDDRAVIKRIETHCVPHGADFVDATEWATALLGNSIAANPFLLGYAWQKGLIPIGRAAIERAIELNDVAVESNKRAFNWGRLAAEDQAKVANIVRPLIEGQQVAEDETQALDALVRRRSEELVQYQDERYAERYRSLVERVRDREAATGVDDDSLSRAVAKNYFKLLAYKDEYEVARLYTNGDFESALSRQFQGDYRLSFHLAPPLIAARDPETGELKKREYGAWVLPLLRFVAGLKRLRGGAFDVFGYTEERRMERSLIAEYEETIARLLDGLGPASAALAAEIAALPDSIRGFGHVKQTNVEAVRAKREELLRAFDAPVPDPLIRAEAAD
jgi:indolepyruvate ferredoxin oxidoreductase